MTPLPLVVSPQAEREAEDAARWYEQRSKGLGAAFLEIIEETLTQIADNPLRFAVVERDVRRASVKRFPLGSSFGFAPIESRSWRFFTLPATRIGGEAGARACYGEISMPKRATATFEALNASAAVSEEGMERRKHLAERIRARMAKPATAGENMFWQVFKDQVKKERLTFRS